MERTGEVLEEKRILLLTQRFKDMPGSANRSPLNRAQRGRGHIRATRHLIVGATAPVHAVRAQAAIGARLIDVAALLDQLTAPGWINPCLNVAQTQQKSF